MGVGTKENTEDVLGVKGRGWKYSKDEPRDGEKMWREQGKENQKRVEETLEYQ